MSPFFRTAIALADILWVLTPDGLKTVWMTVPSSMRLVILTAISLALLAAAFRVDRLWIRIVASVSAAMLILYIIAQLLNYSSR
jgi:predicted acyltransferase